MKATPLCVKVLSTALLLLVGELAWGSPAFRRARLHKQSDGRTLTIYLAGDESRSYYKTVDDIPLWLNDGGDYCYMEWTAAGLPRAGELIAHERDERSATEQLAAVNALSALTTQQATSSLLRGYAIGSQSGASVNALGEVVVPIILVEFTDMTFASEADSLGFVSDSTWLDEQFNLLTGPSVKRYFRDQSDSLFIPTFEFIGPVTLSQTMAYYGQNNSSGNDRYYTQMLKEAVDSALSMGYDLSRFADDGEVSFFAVVHAGQSEEVSGESDDLWSRYLASFDYTTGGINFGAALYVGERNDFGYGYEQQNGIGIFCHEFSHALGLPDMYTNTTVFGMDYWDLMDYGEFYALAERPTGYTAYEKEFMGWLTIDTLVWEKQTVTLAPLAGGSGTRAFKILNPNNTNEYYVLSNLQSWNWFPSALGYGMMINWINYKSSLWTGNRVNRTTSELNITLLPADGERTYHGTYAYYYKGDLWPGYTENTSLTSLTTPGDSVYSGDFLGIKINDIHTDDDLNIVFAFMADGFLSAPTEVTITEVSDTALSAEWTAVENASAYVVTLSVGGEVLRTDTVAETAYSIDQLDGGTDYELSVIAIDEDWIDSDAQTATATTLPTAVSSLLADGSDATAEVYSLDGRLVATGGLQELAAKLKGHIYIVRTADGLTQKISF